MSGVCKLPSPLCEATHTLPASDSGWRELRRGQRAGEIKFVSNEKAKFDILGGKKIAKILFFSWKHR